MVLCVRQVAGLLATDEVLWLPVSLDLQVV
jgi:hypothetical protein